MPAPTRGFPDQGEVVTTSVEETEAYAAALADRLQPGDILLLSGDLGAGKTAFVRGLATGLGLAADTVTSPTFSLVHEHRGGRLDLFHVDLYRLRAVDPADLGLHELGAGAGVLAVEWPERLAHDLGAAMTVRIEAAGESERRITVSRSTDPPR